MTTTMNQVHPSATRVLLTMGPADIDALPAKPVPGCPGVAVKELWRGANRYDGLIVYQPGAFGDSDLFAAYMSAWTRTYLDAGAGKGKLPGSRGARLEQEGREHGIELPGAIAKELIALGERLRVPFQG